MRGEHVNTNESEQRTPSLKDLWASNPSSSLHSFEPSYTDFRGKFHFNLILLNLPIILCGPLIILIKPKSGPQPLIHGSQIQIPLIK